MIQHHPFQEEGGPSVALKTTLYISCHETGLESAGIWFWSQFIFASWTIHIGFLFLLRKGIMYGIHMY